MKFRRRFSYTSTERSINGGFRLDGKEVVFLMNVTSVEEARSLLEQLPLGKAKLMDFEYKPLGPFAPLRVRLNTPAK